MAILPPTDYAERFSNNQLEGTAMEVQTAVTIDAPAESVWAVVTNFDAADQVISGIEKVEVLERPVDGLVGFTWRETRKIGGRKATETMWITEAVAPSYYLTEARSHGAIYHTRVDLEENGGRTTLRMNFSGEAQSFAARFFAAALGWLMKRSVTGALQKDLEDIKTAVEATRS